MFGSIGLTLKVTSLLSWHRKAKSFLVRVIFTNQPAPKISSTVIGPPLVFASAAVAAGGSVVGACVAGTSVGGGRGVTEGTSVGAWVGTTVTTTVCRTTAAV